MGLGAATIEKESFTSSLGLLVASLVMVMLSQKSHTNYLMTPFFLRSSSFVQLATLHLSFCPPGGTASTIDFLPVFLPVLYILETADPHMLSVSLILMKTLLVGGSAGHGAFLIFLQNSVTCASLAFTNLSPSLPWKTG